GDHVEHRGFAGAVRPQQAHRFTAAHVEVHALHHLASAEALLDALHREERFAVALLRAWLTMVGRLARAGLVSLRLKVLPRMVRLLVAALLVIVLLIVVLRIILLLMFGLRVAALLVIVSVVLLRHVRRPRTVLGRQRLCCILATGLWRFLWQ